jgi:hypothetical protein
VLLAYIAAVADPGTTDRGSVFVRRSDDDGRTWTQPIRVAYGDTVGALQLTLLSTTGNDEALLLWSSRNPRSSARRDPLVTAMSSDAGRTWSRHPEGLRDSVVFHSATAATSPRGVVALVVAESGPERGERVILTREAHAWRTVWRGDVRAIAAPLLLSDDGGAVGNVWTIWPENVSRDLRDGPVTRLARVALACSN